MLKHKDHDLIETMVSSETLAQGKLLTVKRDTVQLPSGSQAYREYIIHPGGVVIVALTAQNEVVLERQFRYPLKQIFIELPAGKLEPNEDVLHAGQRELCEETGFTAKHWVKLGVQHPCIGYSSEAIHTFLAYGLRLGKQERDADEVMEIFTWSWAKLMQAIEVGDITDSKTITALMLAERYCHRQKLVG